MNSEKKKKSFKEGILITAAFIFVVLIFFLYYWYITSKTFDCSTDQWATRGQFGDMFGAVTALFSALAFAGIIATIYLQHKELIETRNEVRKQNETLARQQFESTFFTLLDNHNNLINRLYFKYLEPHNHPEQAYILEASGINVFEGFIELMKRRDEFKKDVFDLDDKTIKELRNLFRGTLKTAHISISLYIQSLVNLLFYVLNSELPRTQVEGKGYSKEFYLSAITAYQPTFERAFIFYFIAYGWTIPAPTEPLTTLRRIEIEANLYRKINQTYIDNNSTHSLLLEKILKIPY